MDYRKGVFHADQQIQRVYFKALPLNSQRTNYHRPPSTYFNPQSRTPTMTNPSKKAPETAAAHEWLQSFHRLGDSLSPEMWVETFYTPDCTMQFLGQPPVHGHEAIIAHFRRQFARLECMKHTIRHVDVTHERIYQEATVTYVVKGDPEQRPIEAQGLAVFGKGVGESQISFFTVYLDLEPLRERMREVLGPV